MWKQIVLRLISCHWKTFKSRSVQALCEQQDIWPTEIYYDILLYTFISKLISSGSFLFTHIHTELLWYAVEHLPICRRLISAKFKFYNTNLAEWSSYSFFNAASSHMLSDKSLIKLHSLLFLNMLFAFKLNSTNVCN